MKVDPVVVLGVCAVGFVGSHLIASHPPIREALVARVGEPGFAGLYSLIAFVFFGPLAFVWWTNIHAGPALWAVRSPGVTHPLMLVAMLGFGFVGASLTSPPPTLMTVPGQTRALEVRGITAVTRHPMSMGLAIWSGSHMALNGWIGDLFWFGSFLALGVLGSLHQDWRNRRDREGWSDFEAQTTWLPLPTPTRLARVGWRGWLGFVGGFAGGYGLYVAHDLLFR